MLGQALTRVGRHNEALEADLRLADLRPKDPVAFYNLACSYSNLENLDAAFDALRRAFDLGYRDYRHMLRDPDLENVRRDRRFKSLLDKKWGKRQPVSPVSPVPPPLGRRLLRADGSKTLRSLHVRRDARPSTRMPARKQ
jgi:tetratricopeptide (TPR) repeat protein